MSLGICLYTNTLSLKKGYVFGGVEDVLYNE